MLIKNYGLFWRRDDVFWGKQKQMGHLQGFPAREAFRLVDFRDQQGVYCLYDENFKIVYVGQAGSGLSQRLFIRLRQHKSDALAERWTRFSWFGIRRVKQNLKLAAETDGTHTKPSAVLDHIEAILISATEPPHNRQGGRFGNEAKQFLQYRDQDRLGPSQEQMLQALWKEHVTK
jgi:hypothetical protein